MEDETQRPRFADRGDRPTGVSPDQIEEAVQHWYASFGDKVSRVQREAEANWRDDLVHYASHLVPPGTHIGRDDADYLTPETRTYLRMIYETAITVVPYDRFDSGALDRLAALIGGGNGEG